MKIIATSASAIPTSRLAHRIRAEALSSRTVERLEREISDELDAMRIPAATPWSAPSAASGAPRCKGSGPAGLTPRQ